MVGKKCFSTVVLIAMLSCVASYYVQPRVSHTPDAIVVDFAGVGFAPFPLGRGYSQIADPEYIPLNPYPMVQYQPTFYNAWPFFRQAAATCGKGPISTPISRSSVSERVAGGSEAKTKTWTFLVYLYDTGITPPSLVNFFCSGTLLSPTKVLTAASCFEKMSLSQMSQVTIKIGNHWDSANDAQSTRRLSQVVIHSQYNSATFASDIAIITLDMPVVFSKTIGPVCLPPASTDPDAYAGQNAMIIGWGQASVDATTTSINLQQALVAVGYNQDCKSDTAISKYMTNTTSCITSFDGSTPTRFTCASDVGGPVLVNSAPNVQGTNAIWTQVAINSYTDAACASTGLKTNVAAFIPWINTYNI